MENNEIGCSTLGAWHDAWLAKITCEQLDDGLGSNAKKSAVFLSPSLLRGSTTEQTWQFLAAAINTYCPDKTAVLTSVAETNR